VLKLIVAENYQEMSQLAASMVAEQIKKKPDSILGLATGSTPLGMYQELIRMNREGEITFRDVCTFNLDEYIGIPKDHDQSYHTFMQKNFFSQIDINKENTHLPFIGKEQFGNENEVCREYDALIEEKGGIDLQILGIGPNGHIGFNEPASALEAGTHIVELAQETREANSRFFNSIEEVPTHAITMGVGSILKSKAILLLASGKNKAEVVARMFSGEVDTQLPASLLQVHPNVTVIVDREAASLLSEEIIAST
jgi:glucosamine-6-phosphate deaminase